MRVELESPYKLYSNKPVLPIISVQPNIYTSSSISQASDLINNSIYQYDTYISNPIFLPPPQNLINNNSSIFDKLKNGFIGKIVSGFNFIKYTISDTYTSLFGENIAQGLYIPPKGINPDKSTINELLNRAADKYNIPRNILKAVALRESNWTMYDSSGSAVAGKNSSSTDWGIMQINDKAHPKAFPRAKEDIVYNIEYGAKYLSKQYRRYNNWYDAVAAYNAGTAIRKDGKYINQKYVDFVFSNISKFK